MDDETKKNFRIAIGLFLISVIISMAIWIYLNKDSVFKQEIKLTFPDGCIETYVNGKLITPECTKGRMMEQNQAGINSWDNIILTNPVNIT